MRYAEFTLMMVPIGLVVAWICGVRGLSRRGTVAALLLLAALFLSLDWFGQQRAFTGAYVPAHLRGDSVIAGHAG